jgi:hypothetical protein
MARLLSNSIPNLLNGVSQQPDTVSLFYTHTLGAATTAPLVF